MTREQYLWIMNQIKGVRCGQSFIKWSIRFVTVYSAICYIAELVCFLLTRDTKIVSCILVPAVSFFAVSFFRNIFHAERPYEKYDFKPLIDKDTKGKSFPSRHVFSGFMIAVTVYVKWKEIGISLIVASIFLAVLRVVSGVHFPKDVIAGAVVALVFGYVGYVLL